MKMMVIEECRQCGFLNKMHGFHFYCSYSEAVAKIYKSDTYKQQLKDLKELFSSCKLPEFQEKIENAPKKS